MTTAHWQTATTAAAHDRDRAMTAVRNRYYVKWDREKALGAVARLMDEPTPGKHQPPLHTSGTTSGRGAAGIQVPVA
ncbi:hypothetical protein T492DRAFT_860353 [Pavlovales sp. CCMP2436]|nr:hypothetical protein T492DRAFT_860353 [Pavlovales sp. CCMP2436]